ncbi:hypothetical protein IB238_09135 [Rhizobium sp. ARZ01]|uniref:hypothetical protein n=1 Tax=Rhizobium sp. ARZ01 TaxID=2769313 RepID=UPI001786FB96|nr:hypothetical protein [Rhizobium sp. ARZ01]MBD9372782.1 hypothetical protein [Rhizobium sp. ARZ01]
MLARTFILATFLATSASAQGIYDDCPGAGKIARRMMEVRQLGVSLTDAMKVAEGADISVREFVVDLVKAAYSEPAYSTGEMQERSVEEFANGIELACYNGRDQLLGK